MRSQWEVGIVWFKMTLIVCRVYRIVLSSTDGAKKGLCSCTMSRTSHYIPSGTFKQGDMLGIQRGKYKSL